MTDKARAPAEAHARTCICIGASTGGTEAVKHVLQALPADVPPVLIVQHMPEMFTTTFARRLNGLCAIEVKEAEDGDRLRPGVAFIAPGHSHLSLTRIGTGLHCRLDSGAPVNRHRPSVDVLFHSVVREFGRMAAGVLLTGMGKDGAAGLLALRRSGAWTIAQDEASCVVYGMPREAVALGAAREILPLERIAPQLLRLVGKAMPDIRPKES